MVLPVFFQSGKSAVDPPLKEQIGITDPHGKKSLFYSGRKRDMPLVRRKTCRRLQGIIQYISKKSTQIHRIYRNGIRDRSVRLKDSLLCHCLIRLCTEHHIGSLILTVCSSRRKRRSIQDLRKIRFSFLAGESGQCSQMIFHVMAQTAHFLLLLFHGIVILLPHLVKMFTPLQFLLPAQHMYGQDHPRPVQHTQKRGTHIKPWIFNLHAGKHHKSPQHPQYRHREKDQQVPEFSRKVVPSSRQEFPCQQAHHCPVSQPDLPASGQRHAPHPVKFKKIVVRQDIDRKSRSGGQNRRRKLLLQCPLTSKKDRCRERKKHYRQVCDISHIAGKPHQDLAQEKQKHHSYFTLPDLNQFSQEQKRQNHRCDLDHVQDT